MMHSALTDKKIVLAVTGSIAAYKSADLVRRLKEAGAEVSVVMTKAACEFITPLTLQTLSGRPVAIELLDADQESAMGHIKLARWADWILIAPASANTIAKLVHGEADDLLTALCLATESPIALAPAMNNKMWSNSATQTNLTQLAAKGCHILGPASGDQACGEQGEGRLLEPDDIVSEMSQLVMPGRLMGKKVVITAGPTHEAIDPVRFISNRSSGKMGYALAKAAAEAGANVTLISGPVNLATPPGVSRHDVESAQEMHEAVFSNAEQCDVFIGCAAVADYRPKYFQTEKIKKSGQHDMTLGLTANPDIISELAKRQNKPFIVGFAAETHDIERYANDKLSNKNLDMVAANHVGRGQGFAVDENAIKLYWQSGSHDLPLAHKSQLARDLMKLIIEHYYAKNPTQNS
jgi:phosphopantothenoylcysteine decarboxylase/phosphopantothenate--cysteine ligase